MSRRRKKKKKSLQRNQSSSSALLLGAGAVDEDRVEDRDQHESGDDDVLQGKNSILSDENNSETSLHLSEPVITIASATEKARINMDEYPPQPLPPPIIESHNANFSTNVPGTREFFIEAAEDALAYHDSVFKENTLKPVESAANAAYGDQNGIDVSIAIKASIASFDQKNGVRNASKDALDLVTLSPAHTSIHKRPSTQNSDSISKLTAHNKHRPKTSASVLLLPRLEPVKLEELKQAKTLEHKPFGGDNYEKQEIAEDKKGKSLSKTEKKKRRPRTAPGPNVKRKSKQKRSQRNRLNKKQIDRRPMSSLSSLSTSSTLLLNRSVLPRPSTTAGLSPQRRLARKKSGSNIQEYNKLFRPDDPPRRASDESNSLGIRLRRKDVHRYKHILRTDVFSPRSKMLSQRQEIVFRARGPDFLMGTYVPVNNESAGMKSDIEKNTNETSRNNGRGEPRLLATIREMCDIIDISPIVAGQFISGGLIDVVCAAAWFFGDGAQENTVERSIAEGASELLFRLCSAPGFQGHVITFSKAVAALGAIIVSNIGTSLKDGSPQEHKNLTKQPKERKDLAGRMRMVSAWASLRSFDLTVSEALHHGPRQAWLAVQSLGALTNPTAQLFLKVGASTGWNQFIEMGGLESLVLAAADGTAVEDLLAPGKLQNLCPDWLDTGKCKNMKSKGYEPQCKYMHVCGMYPAATGVTSSGEIVNTRTKYGNSSPASSRRILAQQLLKNQFRIDDFEEMWRVRRERVASSSSATADMLSTRADVLLSQLSLRENFISFDRATSGLDMVGKSKLAERLQDVDKQTEEFESAYYHDEKHSSFESHKDDSKRIIGDVLVETDDDLEEERRSRYIPSKWERKAAEAAGYPDIELSIPSPPKRLSPRVSPSMFQRARDMDTTSLLLLHLQSILVGSNVVAYALKHTIRQHIEWLRRCEKRKQRLAIEKAEWKTIKQERVKARMNRMMDRIRKEARKDPHEARLVGIMLELFANTELKFERCPQRAHADIAKTAQQNSAGMPSFRQSSRTDKPHLWKRVISMKVRRNGKTGKCTEHKVRAFRCHHCLELAKDIALPLKLRATDSPSRPASPPAFFKSRKSVLSPFPPPDAPMDGVSPSFTSCTELGLRLRQWVSMLPQAFLKMYLPNFHSIWILDCQLNNPVDCSRAFYRLSRHVFFAEWIGALVPEPKQLSDGRRERFLLIEVPKGRNTGRHTVHRSQKSGGTNLPRGVDPTRYGYPGLTLQN